MSYRIAENTAVIHIDDFYVRRSKLISIDAGVFMFLGSNIDPKLACESCYRAAMHEQIELF